MMNFNVKYHFPHALMHCLRREGALGEDLEIGSIIVSCKKKKAYSSTCPCAVSELCSLCTATVTHPWMCTHPTDPQPCKHIPKWSLTFRMPPGMHHASPHGWGLTSIDLPPTYSLVSTPWLVPVYSDTACTHPTPLQTDLSFSLFLLSSSLFLLSSLLLFPLQRFCQLSCAKFCIDCLWSCLPEWKTQKEDSDFRAFIIFFSNLVSVGFARQH